MITHIFKFKGGEVILIFAHTNKYKHILVRRRRRVKIKGGTTPSMMFKFHQMVLSLITQTVQAGIQELKKVSGPIKADGES